jgi:hypothetical protein
METALEFYEEVGGQKAMAKHANEMLDFAENLFKKEFNVESMPIAKELRAPYMRIVGKQSKRWFMAETRNTRPTVSNPTQWFDYILKGRTLVF